MSGLNFTESQDGVARASTWIEFRVSQEDLAYACARAAIDKFDQIESPGDKNVTFEGLVANVTKKEIIEALRTMLFNYGHHNPDLSQIEEWVYTLAVPHIQVLYPVPQ